MEADRNMKVGVLYDNSSKRSSPLAPHITGTITFPLELLVYLAGAHKRGKETTIQLSGWKYQSRKRGIIYYKMVAAPPWKNKPEVSPNVIDDLL